jgi:septum formation protein
VHRPLLLLASASPRRRFLLRLLGVRFTVRPSGAAERARPGESPRVLVRRLALAKARAVAARHPRAWVLGADTVVCVGRRILGRPRDRREADAMLRLLSGRTHRVWTGMAIVAPGRGPAPRAEACTRVRVAALSRAERLAYLESGEWRGKAGAYAIQGRFAAYVRGLDGEYTNVVGLPLERLRRLLKAAGFSCAPVRLSRRPAMSSASLNSGGQRRT